MTVEYYVSPIAECRGDDGKEGDEGVVEEGEEAAGGRAPHP